MHCLSRRRLATGVVAVFAALLCAAASPSASRAQRNNTPETVPGEIVVGFRAGSATFRADSVGLASAARAAATVGRVAGGQPLQGAYRVKLHRGVSVRDAIAALRARPDVRYVEPVYIGRIDATPNDPSYAQQYAPVVTKANSAWENWNPQATVRLAILDTGVQANHPDLTNNMLRDGGGVVIGRDFVNNDNNADDDQGHGTHCAGIAAAQINNGVGVAGVAGWTGAAGVTDTASVKIMPVKVMGANGSGTSTQCADGIRWAADNGADVISLSLGFNAYVAVVDDAVQYAWGRGCVVVAAAGNSAVSSMHYPAAYANVISVAATDSTDTLATFSNYGSWVKIAAPGVGILSTYPGSTYRSMQGTSMACPFVAGAAALLKAHAPAASNAAIYDILLANTDPYTPYSGRTIASGAGRINVLAALLAVQNPGAPALAALSVSPTSIWGGKTATGTVTLTAAAEAGGAEVTLSSSGAAATVPATVTVPAGATSASFTVTGGGVTVKSTVTITAAFSGRSRSASLTVSPLLTNFTGSPTALKGGAVVTTTLTFAAALPTGGAVVAMTTSDATRLPVPATLNIPAGACLARVSLPTAAVGSQTAVTLTVTYAGVAKTATVTLKPPVPVGLTISPASVVGGAAAVTATVTLDAAAPSGGASVALSSGNTSAATVPASVTVAAGARTATFPVTTANVTASTPAVITATYAGVSRTGTVTVLPWLSGLTLSPASVVGGASATGTVTLNTPAPSGGVSVALSSGNTSAATVPASVTVAAGARTATFTITTVARTTTGTVAISARTSDVTKTAVLTIQAPTLSALAFNPTAVVGGNPSTATVTLTGVAPAGGVVLTLASANTSLVAVASGVTVAAGSRTATFTATTSGVSTAASVTITARQGTLARSVVLRLNPPL